MAAAAAHATVTAAVRILLSGLLIGVVKLGVVSLRGACTLCGMAGVALFKVYREAAAVTCAGWRCHSLLCCCVVAGGLLLTLCSCSKGVRVHMHMHM